ncbi:MAG TPA: hypothetical protein VFK88_06210 [Gallionella sp.]|nr:hypothetical protein [Gallionella sp.]
MSPLFHIQSHSFDGVSVPSSLAARRWDMAAIGTTNNEHLDARSKAACAFAVEHAQEVFRMDFINNTAVIDDAKVTHGAICVKLRGCNSLLIEATTLNCPELLYLIRAARKEGVQTISFLYLEPEEYRRTLKGRLSDYRDFDLSGNRRFRSVQGFGSNLTDIAPGHAVFFLGYEKARLGQALEQEETLRDWSKHAVFGVPAFEPSWEIDSIANNIQYFSASSFEARYAGAASVEAAYGLLNQLMSDNKAGIPIVVAPLGTKPHTIGAALFLVEHPECDDAILLYDHPQKNFDRSYNIRRWHLYDVVTT